MRGRPNSQQIFKEKAAASGNVNEHVDETTEAFYQSHSTRASSAIKLTQNVTRRSYEEIKPVISGAEKAERPCN